LTAVVPREFSAADHLPLFLEGQVMALSRSGSTVRTSVLRRPISRRSFMAIAGSSAALAAVSGCGTGSSAAGAGGKTAISFQIAGATPQVTAFFNQTVLPKFAEQQPSITVNLSNVSWADAGTKLETGAVSHTNPDLFVIGSTTQPALSQLHGLKSLADLAAGWDAFSTLNAAAVDNCKTAGDLQAIPFTLDVRGLIYNESMLEKAGISTPPATWGEYKTAATKLMQRSGGQITVEGADWAIDDSYGLAQTFYLLLVEAGGKLFSEPNASAFAANSPEGVEALSYLTSFYASKLSSPDFKVVASSPPPIALGQAAMEMNNVGAITQASPSIASSLKFAAPLKMSESAEPVGLQFVNRIGMSADTGNAEPAWEFVKFLFTPEILAKWNALLGQVPPLPDAAKLDPFASGVYHQAVVNAQYAEPIPAVAKSPKIMTEITRLVSAAVYLQMSPQDALDQMQTSVDQLLQA
jgi:multiple sugar transport system substrate-binding protein